MILVRPRNPSARNQSKLMMYKSGEGINPLPLNNSDEYAGGLYAG